MAGKSKFKVPSLKDLGGLFINKSSTLTTLNSGALMPSTTFIGGSPVWRNFSELIYLLNCYYDNPIVNAVINIKAEAFANIKFRTAKG